MGVGRTAAKALMPVARKTAPVVTSSYVREILERAIDGGGPFKGAAGAADARLVQARGDVEDAVRDLIDAHVRMAGVQGFLTNIGGAVTLPVMIPANVTGLALLQCHLVAGVAHLRGYDLDDPRVRNAVMACLLGEDAVHNLVRRKRIPSTPMAIATSPMHDPQLDKRIGTMVTAELWTKITGRRAALMVGRRVPLLGGGVGAFADGLSTYQVGSYAERELRDRRTRRPA
ncbi:MAG TPA: EcsC family protein [Nocardioidaceae bacterium]|nr:EcsC family protein [Nocardioidaceae bacterium]